MIRRVACAVLAAALVAAHPAFAQTLSEADAYSAAVRAYAATGDAALAVRGIREWSPGQFETAVDRYLTRSDAVFDKAATFQLEIALALVRLAPGVAEKHLDLGHVLIRQLRQRPRISPEQLTAFAERWYAAAGSAFLWVNNPTVAALFINRGLQLSPASTELRLIDGVRLEVEAQWGTTGAFAAPGRRTRSGNERLRYFLLAKSHYQKLLREQPALVPARVRLGRLLWMLDELPDALAELTRARADARDRKHQYLAAMFLGALHEQRKNVAAAREAYEAALSVAPGSQAATVAVGHLDVMAGRPDRAQALARTLLFGKRQPDAWWSYTNGGVDVPAVLWLREWATR